MTARRKVCVIGSGFGGAVMACRLAESGRFDVTVLERGPRYGRAGFPRRNDQVRRAFWDPDDGYFGQFEYRSFGRSGVDVLTCAGLGGGSLIYSNVLYRMPAPFFATWPGGLTRTLLDPCYQRALEMLEGQPYPVDRPAWPYLAATPKAQALAEAVARIGASPRGGPAMRLEWPPLAVQFSAEPGAAVINGQGVAQTSCIMCGECNLGCNTQAKNTLDLNYLTRATQHGAEVRTWCAVSAIDAAGAPDAGWILRTGDPRYRATTSERFDLVVVAAGSLGSTELLLDLAKRRRLSDRVGTQWSPNGDMLGILRKTPWPLQPSAGPVITGAIHVDAASYPDGFAGGAWIEDGGFPAALAWYLGGRLQGWRVGLAGLRGLLRLLQGWFGRRLAEANVGDDLAPFLFGAPGFEHTMLMLAMGRDRATGRFALRDGPGRTDRLHLDWRPGDGELHYQHARAAMARIGSALGSDFTENPVDWLGRYISVHPIGGLPLGDRRETGAIDATSGEAFGCPDLYVVDGSVIPEAVGPNPSLTIAALAELFAARLVEREAARRPPDPTTEVPS